MLETQWSVPRDHFLVRSIYFISKNFVFRKSNESFTLYAYCLEYDYLHNADQ